MSKKRNTLKDLDEFLKQQAATLVAPPRLTPVTPQPEPEKQELPAPAQPDHTVSMEKILKDLQTLFAQEGQASRQRFYDLIIRSLETQNPSTPEDKMLINTALYLKSGSQWKEAIREYWRNKL